MLRKNSDDGSGGTIALTIGLLLSLLGLFAASVVVFLKWRKKSAPAKKQKRYWVTLCISYTYIYMYLSNVVFSCGTLDARVDKYTVTVDAELTEHSEVKLPQFTHTKYFSF